MTTWATRIKLRMKELGMTQEIVAQKMGITRGAITHYLAGRRVPPLRQFQKLAAILKVDPAWLQFGTPKDNKQISKTKDRNEKHNASQNRIPLLSWDQVSEFIDTNNIARNEIKSYVTDFYVVKPNWYALKIKGDAMISPIGNSKSFHEDDVIIIDSDKEVAHGCYVIAVLPQSKEATFKQYVIDGGVCYLKPLNPQYPITQINKGTHICGVVVAHLCQF